MNRKKELRSLPWGRTHASGPRSVQLSRSRFTNPGKGKSGVTLIEVLLATVLVSVAIASLAQVSRMGTQAALRAQLETLAAIQCESILDGIMSGKANESSQIQSRWMSAEWHVDISSRSSRLPGFREWTVTVRHDREPNGAFTLSRLQAIEE